MRAGVGLGFPAIAAGMTHENRGGCQEPRGMRRRQPKKRALEKLLRQTQVLRNQVVAFKESAREVWEPLDQIVPDSEVEAMDSPRADLLGILECLLNEDFEDAVRHLGEVEELLVSPEGKGSPGGFPQ